MGEVGDMVVLGGALDTSSVCWRFRFSTVGHDGATVRTGFDMAVLTLLFLSSVTFNALYIRALKRGLANPASAKPINIRQFSKLLNVCGLWAGVCLIEKMFDTANGATHWYSSPEALGLPFVQAISQYLGVFICLVLAQDNVGSGAFSRAGRFAGAWSFIVFAACLTTVVICDGNNMSDASVYNDGRLSKGGLAAAAATIATHAVGALIELGCVFCAWRGGDMRYSLKIFAAFIAGDNLAWAAGEALILAGDVSGLCLNMAAQLLYFGGFLLIIYYVLNEDARHIFTVDLMIGQNHDQYLIPCREHWIPSSHLAFVRSLGHGSGGIVDLYTYRRELVVVKKLAFRLLTRDAIAAFAHETRALQALTHPNVVAFRGVWIDPPQLGIVMEYCSRGNLYDAIAQCRLGAHCPPLRVAMDVARCMVFLQSLRTPIIHRDLKSLNVLLSEKWEGKLCDFGECYFLQPHPSFSSRGSAVKGTPAWCAPEMLTMEPPSLKTDVYSFGIVLWELVTWEEPFVIDEEQELRISMYRRRPSQLAARSSTGTNESSGDDGSSLKSRSEQSSASVRLALASTTGGGHWTDGFRYHMESYMRRRSASLGIRRRRRRRREGEGRRRDDDDDDNGGGGGGGDTLLWQSRSDQSVVAARDALLGGADVSPRNQQRFSSPNQDEEDERAQRQNFLPSASSHQDADPFASSSASIAVGINTHESALEAVAMRKLRPPMPVGLPISISELITSCWHSNPRMRPSFEDAVAQLERIVDTAPISIDSFPFPIAADLKAMPRVDLSPWR